MIPELKASYQSTLDKFKELNHHSKRLSKTLSFLRLFVFLGTVILIYIFAAGNSVPALIISLVAGTALFISLMQYHSKLIMEIKIREAIIKINQDEITALDGNYSVFEDGAEFNDAAHPFSFDLDVFGPGSLFQFINRTSTKTGGEKLASILQKPYIKPEIIRANQHAINELKDQKEWRQEFQAIGLVYEDHKSDKDRILNWVQLPPLFGHKLYSILIVFLPILTIFMICLLSMGFINGKLFILYLTAIPLGIPTLVIKKIKYRYHLVNKTTEMLSKYSLLVKKIESLSVKSEKLDQIKRSLIRENQTASKSIKSLSSILTALDNRINPFSWAFLNGLLFWDILQMHRLENWQKLHKNELGKWFETIAEMDALICFSNFYYNQPESNFPEILSDENQTHAENLGHPLIIRDVRVNNPLEIHNRQFLIITGANMAGKSTYLRTVGINLILGMCGAPVCATKFSFKPVEIYTSIRTNDSLQKNESYFYSELKRLKAIIDELKTGKELFIILDEILKGTNSKDKHAGSEALLKQLIRYNASGIIATHDVALGILQESFPNNILNRCFEVDIDGDRLTFDYKLQEGVSKNMNATLLMREMGITV